ncbi:MAG: NFACT RNA binding domain-containing protein [Candidatus Pacearchaeota archaeon]|jgi:hypothetical protein
MLKIVKKPREMPDYHKYRWFYTSSNKLVIGGKSAEQNESLVREFMKCGKNYVVMHTREPGSPFSIIQSDRFTEKDLEEVAIFTACFSRAWREKKKEVVVDIFRVNQITKTKGMKSGTFGVIGKVEYKKAHLRLYLTQQKGILRAVPFNDKAKHTICIVPGSVSKEHFAEQIAIKLEVVREEVLQALPSGGFRICN